MATSASAGATARLRSRQVEVGGIETRAVSAARRGRARPCSCTAGSTTPTPGSRCSTGSRSPSARRSPTTCPGSAPRRRSSSGSVLDQLVDFAAAAVEAAAEASGREVVVAGNSLGGWVALRLAAAARPAAGRDRPDRPGGRADGAGVLHPRPDPGGLADHRHAGAGAAGGRPLGRRRPLPPARLRRPRRRRPGGRRPLHPLSRRPAGDPRADRVREAPAPRARRSVRRRRDRGPGERDLGRARPALPGRGRRAAGRARCRTREIAVLPGRRPHAAGRGARRRGRGDRRARGGSAQRSLTVERRRQRTCSAAGGAMAPPAAVPRPSSQAPCWAACQLDPMPTQFDPAIAQALGGGAGGLEVCQQPAQLLGLRPHRDAHRRVRSSVNHGGSAGAYCAAAARPRRRSAAPSGSDEVAAGEGALRT